MPGFRYYAGAAAILVHPDAPRTPASPSRASVDRPAARRVRVGRPADDSQRLAVALIRGVAGIPAGRERAEECTARRAEISRGIESVLQVLEAAAEALRSPAALQAGSDGEPSPEPLRHLKGLRGAASVTSALETAARTLRTLDSFGTSEPEYSRIAEQLSLVRDTLRDFTGLMLDACKTPLRRPERAAEPAAPASAGKLEALSETCGTPRDTCGTPRRHSTGWTCCVSSFFEASSEAGCDSGSCSSSDVVARSPGESRQAPAAAPATDEAWLTDEVLGAGDPEHAAMLRVVEESKAQARADMRAHLQEFLGGRPQARFEEWIADYHPDNVIPPGRDVRGLPTIDRRHYHERSDHRAIWNEHVSDPSHHIVTCSLSGRLERS